MRMTLSLDTITRIRWSTYALFTDGPNSLLGHEPNKEMNPAIVSALTKAFIWSNGPDLMLMSDLAD